MASFFRQLGRGAKSFFGRQLPHAFVKYGRQLSNVAGDVSGGLGKAHRVLSSIEKVTDKIPVLGQVVNALDSVAIAGQHGSGAINQLGRGNFQGAYAQGRDAFKSGKTAIGDVGRAGVALAPYLV